MSDEKLQVEITAETSQAKKNFDSLNETLKKLGSKMSSMRVNSAEMGDALESIVKYFKNFKSPAEAAIKLFGDMDKQAKRLENSMTKAFSTGNIKQFNKAQAELQKLQQNKQLAAGFLSGKLRYGENLSGKEMSREDIMKSGRDIRAKLRRENRSVQKNYKEEAEGVKLANEQQENFNKHLQAEQQKLVSAKAALANYELSLDPVGSKMNQLKKELDEAENAFIKFQASGDKVGLANAKKRIAGLKDEMEKLEKSTKKSQGWMSKLWGRLRNISIYRAIRSLLKSITSGFQEGMQNFVQYSDDANDTLSNLNSALKQIRNTMGVSLTYTLQALEPLLMNLANGFNELLNSFNYAMAKLSGQTVYQRAKFNLESYRDQLEQTKGTLADFDKFRVLDGSTGTDASDMFETIKLVDEEETKTAQFFEHALTVIAEIGKMIGEVFSQLTEMGVWDVLLDVIVDISKVIASIIVSIGKVIKGLHDVGLLRPLLIGIATAWLAIKMASVGAAIAQLFAINPLIGATAGLALAGVIAGTIGSALDKAGSVKGFADGGFTTANFIATNENGVREWVGKNGNATAVVNDSQMSELMYQAVKDGCYEGVIGALSDADAYGSTNTNTTANVQIQGETIFTIVKDVAARQGLKFSKV